MSIYYFDLVADSNNSGDMTHSFRGKLSVTETRHPAPQH